MNEPRRWLDAKADAPSEVRALLAVGAVPAELPLAIRARVRASLRERCAPRVHPGTFWSLAFGAAVAATALGWPPAPPGSSALHGRLAQRAAEPRAVVSATPSRAASASAPVSPSPSDAHASAASAGEAASRVAEGGAVLAGERETAVSEGAAAAVSSARRSPTAARLERWREQRWANETRRSRERIAALVDAILKPDARLLEDAAGEVKADPQRALALIEAFRKRYPMAEIPAPSAVVEVDALRRLGRFDEALARARELAEAPRKDYYADEMRERFAFLEL